MDYTLKNNGTIRSMEIELIGKTRLTGKTKLKMLIRHNGNISKRNASSGLKKGRSKKRQEALKLKAKKIIHLSMAKPSNLN